MIPPCSAISDVDTTGWIPISVRSLHKNLTMLLPRSFVKDSTDQRWEYARRKLVIAHKVDFWPSLVDSVSCLPGSSKLGFSECEDLLAGVLFRLVSTFDLEDGMYHVCAIDGPETMPNFHVAIQFHAMSPDSADQEVFMTMFRTLRPQVKTKK